MFKVKDKNGVEALLPKYVEKCTTVGSGNIFVGKAKNRFVKQADGSFVGLASGKDKDENGEFFEDRRINDTLKICYAMSCEEIVNSVLSSVLSFRGDAKQSDDITLLSLKRL